MRVACSLTMIALGVLLPSVVGAQDGVPGVNPKSIAADPRPPLFNYKRRQFLIEGSFQIIPTPSAMCSCNIAGQA